jgi:putative phosphonate metabolism protein
MRYAIYFTPGRDDPLTRVAANWLGRDPFTGATMPAPAIGRMSQAEIAFHTAAARRYGFHATLKAPFRLADGETEQSLDKAVEVFAESVDLVHLPRIRLDQIDGFFALLPEQRLPALNQFADDIVVAFERFRAPLTDAEIERRNPDAMKPAEFRNLCQWGYPYVFEAFRFHMTLSGRVADHEAVRVRSAIEEFFGSLLDEPLLIDGIALFVEPEAGAPFHVRSRYTLGRRRERKSA